jgi:hypothetical protein
MHYFSNTKYICKPTVIVLLFSFLFTAMLRADEGDAINIDVLSQGNAIIIYYDLIPFADRGRYDVTLQISTDGGRTYDTSSNLVTGDIGKNIYPGMRKRIIWYPDREYIDPIGPERYTFRILTERRGGGRGLLYVILGAVVAGGGTAAYFLLGGSDDSGFPDPPDRPGNQ